MQWLYFPLVYHLIRLFTEHIVRAESNPKHMRKTYQGSFLCILLPRNSWLLLRHTCEYSRLPLHDVTNCFMYARTRQSFLRHNKWFIPQIYICKSDPLQHAPEVVVPHDIPTAEKENNCNKKRWQSWKKMNKRPVLNCCISAQIIYGIRI